ncbi:uncharacterized protein LOC131633570 [Vicia villosa]|uniref:uncharacterized protein LOC131633570 n=1 Tax=Vicia villosa TaxID=3911 RepID=UPI00273AC163|nr:uncharacterized protein LOC131633570 [Vicia villosa]XP_058760252.1 uncharacterized protein LOC131633570 [Vicia villosa]XP_058760253.1 uncharacterized protein LOC131633570 [Vicia villosa]
MATFMSFMNSSHGNVVRNHQKFYWYFVRWFDFNVRFFEDIFSRSCLEQPQDGKHRQKIILHRKIEEATMAIKRLKELLEARKSSLCDHSVYSNGYLQPRQLVWNNRNIVNTFAG